MLQFNVCLKFIQANKYNISPNQRNKTLNSNRNKTTKRHNMATVWRV